VRGVSRRGMVSSLTVARFLQERESSERTRTEITRAAG